MPSGETLSTDTKSNAGLVSEPSKSGSDKSITNSDPLTVNKDESLRKKRPSKKVQRLQAKSDNSNAIVIKKDKLSTTAVNSVPVISSVTASPNSVSLGFTRDRFQLFSGSKELLLLSRPDSIFGPS